MMMREDVYQDLAEYVAAQGTSFSGFVRHLLNEYRKPEPQPFDVEAAVLFCRLDGKTAERLRNFASDA